MSNSKNSGVLNLTDGLKVAAVDSRAVNGQIDDQVDVQSDYHNDDQIDGQIDDQIDDQSDGQIDENIGAIDNLYTELFNCQDTAELYQKITDIALSQTSADSVYIALLDSSSSKLKILNASGAFNRNLVDTEYAYGEGILGEVWEKGDSVFTNDPASSSAIHTFEAGTQILASPLIQNDTLAGVLSIVADVKSLEDLSSQLIACQEILKVAAVALSNLTMLATTRAALKHMHTVSDISRALNDVSSADDAYFRVCEKLVEGINVCRASVVMFDCVGTVVKSTLVRSPECVQECAFATDEKWMDELALKCFEKQELIIQSPKGTEFNDYAFAVPLVKNEKVIGAINVSRLSDKSALDADLPDTLKAIALQLCNTLDRLNVTKALEKQAFHDPLTRLANRAKFDKELRETLDTGISGALMFIDLDGFKKVNDTLGHAVGDQVLRCVANRFGNKLNSCDTLARMGGDEFAVILRESNDAASVMAVANQLLSALSRTFEIQNSQVNVGASIGISRFPQDGVTADKLLRSADVAMYEAKNKGKGCVLMFNEGTVDARFEVSQMHKDMHNALLENQFELHYQPQLCCSFHKVRGVEALLRWNHPERGLVPPDEFIPLAEQTGLINDIGDWVLDKALEQVAQWQNTPELKNLRIGINVAALQLQHDHFVDRVLERIAFHKVPADLVELELTESVVMEDILEVAKRIKALRNAGVRIAIDDFGTGYSSLSYLQDLPLDVLKIDKAFVSRLEDEEPDQSLANTIALLAVGLGLETVAEGVETLKQRDAITAMGCDLIQGNYYSGALKPEKILDYVINCSS